MCREPAAAFRQGFEAKRTKLSWGGSRAPQRPAISKPLMDMKPTTSSRQNRGAVCVNETGSPAHVCPLSATSCTPASPNGNSADLGCCPGSAFAIQSQRPPHPRGCDDWDLAQRRLSSATPHIHHENPKGRRKCHTTSVPPQCRPSVMSPGGAMGEEGATAVASAAHALGPAACIGGCLANPPQPTSALCCRVLTFLIRATEEGGETRHGGRVAPEVRRDARVLYWSR